MSENMRYIVCEVHRCMSVCVCVCCVCTMCAPENETRPDSTFLSFPSPLPLSLPQHSLSSVPPSSLRYRDGINESAPLVQWLWQTLDLFTNEEKILFLRFVSGRSRLPTRVSEIPQRFQIMKGQVRQAGIHAICKMPAFTWIFHITKNGVQRPGHCPVSLAN